MTPTRLRLRVQPGARTSGVIGRHGHAWKVRVQAVPERGRATEAVLALLADTLGLARNDVTLVSGESSRDKVVEIAGMPPEETERRLAAAGDRASGGHDVVPADRALPEPPGKGEQS